MIELTGETVIQALAGHLRESIPEVDIRRWRHAPAQIAHTKERIARGNPDAAIDEIIGLLTTELKNRGTVFETRPLNVFLERDEFDPNNPDVYPYLFISEYNISSRRFFNPGGKDKFYFTYSFAIAYYVDIRPTDVGRIPRVNEEMRQMQRKLMIVLDRLEILGDAYHIETAPPPAVSEGVLHFFIQIPDVAEYVFSDPIPTVKKHELDIVQYLDMPRGGMQCQCCAKQN